MNVTAFRLVLVAALMLPAAASAQQPPVQKTPPQEDTAPLASRDVLQMLDAYALYQAQNALQLSDSQYGTFAARLKALQDARRRHQMARQRILADMRRLVNRGRGDDGELREQLKALRDEDAQAANEIRTALDGVDAVLDVRQQARFRLFEERMEARKLELLMKVRQQRGRGRIRP
jgi:hypothetical protein